jgi:hypothetical protein
MESAGKRQRSSPETAQGPSTDPGEQVGSLQGPLLLRWFQAKDNPNASLHEIKATQKPTSQVVDAARFHITEDVSWEAARLEKEAAEAAGGADGARHAFLSRAEQNVANYYHVSVATVINMRRTKAEKGSPTKKTRPGRPKVYGDDAKVRILHALNSENGRTIEQAKTLLEEGGTFGTTTTYHGHVRHSPGHSTIGLVRQEGKKIGVPRRPVLTELCMRVRLGFSQELLLCLQLDPHRPEVHLDEAYISVKFGGTGVLIDHQLSPVLESAKIKYLRSRTHPTQIMVLIAIAKPRLLNPLAAGTQGTGEAARFDPKQNGKVAIFRIVDEFVRTKKWSKTDEDGVTRSHEVGDVYVEPAMLNSTKYRNLMTQPDGILEKIRGYYGPDVKVTLQEDGAPPHGRITRKTISSIGTHEELVAEAKTRFIDLVRQPPNSPELNACDLGVWRSLQSRVKAMNLNDESWKDTHGAQERLWASIQHAWEETQPQIIFNIFEVRNEIARELAENQGGAIVREHHVGVRKKWGTG